MKIKPLSRFVLDTERFHDCAAALEPYVYALFRIVDYRQADTAQPNFRHVREAARAAGWDGVVISVAIGYLTVASAMAGEPARAADDVRRLRKEPRSQAMSEEKLPKLIVVIAFNPDNTSFKPYSNRKIISQRTGPRCRPRWKSLL
jgi:hypothetical protein